MKQSKFDLHLISKNIFTTLAHQILALLMSLAASIIIARSLGPGGNGQYSVAMLLPTSLIVFLNLGISSANVFYVGRHSVSPVIACRASILIWSIVTSVGVAIGVLLIFNMREEWFPGVPSVLLWLAFASFPLGMLQSYLSSLLQAVQDFQRFNIVTILSPVVMLVLVIIFLLLRCNVFAVISAAVLTQFA
ncbi:oligosaccharide flippase family protein, partial [Oscillochloris sp. ZM17-4]|uniref:oligosaccharide flippase family protein n=1 Tax=Oscillochloris sp. ZM17-4 TaxID=2866714 RepID=UPI001C731079